jgi:nucleotide-binding universal stress UspA family protein
VTRAVPDVWDDQQMDAAPFELGTDGPTRILVGVDGTDTSMRAAAYAGGLARRQGARLIVLYVATPPATSIATPEASVAIKQSHEQFADELRGQLEELAPQRGIDAELVVRTGSPYGELLKLAEERRVDAIVVGASTQAGHRLIGSLASKLVRHAAWPVTVVP